MLQDKGYNIARRTVAKIPRATKHPRSTFAQGIIIMEEQKASITFSSGLRATAQVFSYLLHPLFIPLLITLAAVTALPEYFRSLKQIAVFSF